MSRFYGTNICCSRGSGGVGSVTDDIGAFPRIDSIIGNLTKYRYLSDKNPPMKPHKHWGR